MGLGRFVTRLFGKKEEPRAPLPQAEERDYSLSELAGYDGSDPTDDAIHSEVYYTRPGPGTGYGTDTRYDRGCAYSLFNLVYYSKETSHNNFIYNGECSPTSSLVSFSK